MMSKDGHEELVLFTERLTLVPVVPAQADEFFPLMRDPLVTKYLAWAPHERMEETISVLTSLSEAHAKGTSYHWAICEDRAVRGMVSLIDIVRMHRLWTVNRAEIAYWIGTAFQGAGLATEATRGVVACAFGILGLNRLRISHTSANPGSGRIAEKLGFRFVGNEREFFEKNGVWYDMNHYELLASDWKRLKGTL